MTRIFFLSILMICLGCSTTDSNSETDQQSLPIPPQKAVDLNVSLNMAQASFVLGYPITLRFILTNNQTEDITFCKLNSPANEGVWNNYFRIKDSKGQPIKFIGTHQLPQYPIHETDMMTIEAHGSRLYSVDIRPMYQLDKAGEYTIHFIGDKVNLLPKSLPASFILKEQ